MQKTGDGSCAFRAPHVDTQRRVVSGDSERDWLICRLLNMGAYCDRDGRPLSEGKVPAEHRRFGVPLDLQICPYAGARAAMQPERRMNSSAMNRVTSTLPEAFGLFLQLRKHYLTCLSRQRIIFFDLWRMGTLSAALPKYLALRKKDSVPDGELPPYIADAYKFSAGINSLMLELAFRETLSIQQPDLPEKTVDALMATADRMLVGEREVCAAPPALILEGLKAFVDGKVRFKTIVPPIETLLRDLEPFANFAIAYANHRIGLWLLNTIHQCLVHDLLAAVGDLDLRVAGNRMAPPPSEGLVVASPDDRGFPTHFDRLPTLNVIRAAIIESSPADRCDRLHTLAGALMSNGARSEPILDALRQSVNLLRENPDINAMNFKTFRYLWPTASEDKAIMLDNAVSRCLRFESVALDTLGALETSLRIPLGHTPMIQLPPIELIALIIGRTPAGALRAILANPLQN